MKKRFLTNEEMADITAAVGKAESTTAGEIRVVVAEDSKRFKEFEDPIFTNAFNAFYKHGLNKTKDKTGVLIFLSVEEHRIQILADEGINKEIDQSVWNGMVTNIAENIRSGHAGKGICEVVQKVGKILTQHFPIQPDDVNELPNEVVVE